MITTNEIKKRFEKTDGGLFQGISIITDKLTGVQYLVNSASDQGGITPLIDKDGKPLLSEPEINSGNDAPSPF